jgi:hypothetical protein
MTAQATDSITFEGQKFTLCNSSGGQLFDPAAYGLNPAVASTACGIAQISPP